jgi:WbqC-like protein family
MEPKHFVSDLFYFANVHWYAQAVHHQVVHLPSMPYQKTLHLNQTQICSANGRLSLSIPLQGGRNQRVPYSQIQISEAENWRKNHLRSIQTNYGKAPFFENIFPYLQDFYTKPFATLADCNTQSFMMVNKILNLQISLLPTSDTQMNAAIPVHNYAYQQVFQDKIAFVPQLSILDLLMNEGRNANSVLQKMILEIE